MITRIWSKGALRGGSSACRGLQATFRPRSFSSVIASLPLNFNKSAYNSATLEISDSYVDLSLQDFESKLAASVATLRSQDKSAIYIKVGMNHAHIIPVAGALGFRFHNAEGSEATLLLWLRDDACKVPPFATHHCGVGGLVLNKDKILVVKEHGNDSKWKLPGGLADLGENLEEAVLREVREETGVEAQFESILTMRHAHKVQFGRSDLYFTCLLTAKSEEITVDAEIQDATWMSPAQLKRECPFPTVLTALEILEKNNLDQAFAGREYKPYYANRMPYQLYSTKALDLWVPNYINDLPPPR